MNKLLQKKFSITFEQKLFLEDYRRWGYADQSGMVREALAAFMKELTTRERRRLMEKKARELSADYKEGGKLGVFRQPGSREAE